MHCIFIIAIEDVRSHTVLTEYGREPILCGMLRPKDLALQSMGMADDFVNCPASELHKIIEELSDTATKNQNTSVEEERLRITIK